jgi:hypothetical protein
VRERVLLCGREISAERALETLAWRRGRQRRYDERLKRMINFAFDVGG